MDSSSSSSITVEICPLLLKPLKKITPWEERESWGYTQTHGFSFFPSTPLKRSSLPISRRIFLLAWGLDNLGSVNCMSLPTVSSGVIFYALMPLDLIFACILEPSPCMCISLHEPWVGSTSIASRGVTQVYVRIPSSCVCIESITSNNHIKLINLWIRQ